MKHLTLKDVFEEHLKNISFDRSLYKDLQRFRILWTQKSDIYIEFLGGNLTGVHPIRFSDADENMLFNNVIKADTPSLRYDLHRLPDIDKTRVVTSNVTYLTLYWLMHEFSKKEDSLGIYPNDVIETYFIMAYKMISSLITHYFIYNVDVSMAKAVYERLSNRYLIKRFGTWQKVFEHRSKDVLKNGLHYERILKGDADSATRAIADMQGRLRETIKNIYKVLVDVKEKNEKIHSSSTIESGDDDSDSIKAILNIHESYIHYVRDVYTRQTDFVNDDLIYLTKFTMKNLPEEQFVKTLHYLSSDVRVIPNSENDFIGLTIVTSIDYLRQNGITGEYNKHVTECLTRLKGYWTSSSVKNKDVIHIKKYLFNVVQKATGVKTSWVITSIVIGILLYIFLRALYKNK